MSDGIPGDVSGRAGRVGSGAERSGAAVPGTVAGRGTVCGELTARGTVWGAARVDEVAVAGVLAVGPVFPDRMGPELPDLIGPEFPDDIGFGIAGMPPLGVITIGRGIAGMPPLGFGSAGMPDIGVCIGARGNGPDIDSTGTAPRAAAEPGVIGFGLVACDDIGTFGRPGIGTPGRAGDGT